MADGPLADEGLLAASQREALRIRDLLKFEFFFPAKTEVGAGKLREVARRLGELGPEFFSVTYGAGGSTRVPRTVPAPAPRSSIAVIAAVTSSARRACRCPSQRALRPSTSAPVVGVRSGVWFTRER